jgi:peptidoglycan/LPS O-acetylase OafA/YrhL
VDARVPALDGIRAVAIAFVLLHHIYLNALHASIVGPFGVTLFLVLSGFLITRVMLEDERRAGRLRLRRFYWRRAWRILPAFYVYLAVVAGLAALRLIPSPSPKEWLASVLYFRNFVAGGNWQTGHLWSLSLEEQFYFCWPGLFVLTRGFRLRFIVLAVVTLTTLRFCLIYLHRVDTAALMLNPVLRMDTFLIGGAFAIGKWPPRLPSGLCLIASLIWFRLALEHRGTWAVWTPVAALLIGLTVASTIESRGFTVRLLSTGPLVWIGTLSYSMYLWQQVFIGEARLRWWSLLAIVGISAASYYFVERPCLKLKNWPLWSGTRVAQAAA